MDTKTGMVMTDEALEALAKARDPRLAEFNPSLRIETKYLTKQAQKELRTTGITRVSKNAKCPCGSHKRFKNCHRERPARG